MSESQEPQSAAPAEHPSIDYLQALQATRRAHRDGSRSALESYLAYPETVRVPRLNSRHWQPDPRDTVSGLDEDVESSQVPEEWGSELFEREQATLPGSEEGWA